MDETVRPTARHVHSVLAAALADPHLLELWRREPSCIGENPVGIDGLDVAKIWGFSGLVTKVRHSDLRSNLPATFRTLDSEGIGIELFACYARTAAELRNQGRRSKLERIAGLIEFLDGWLDRGNAIHTLVWDLIRHESAIFKAQSHSAAEAGVAGNGNSQTRELSADCVPALRAGAAFHEMNCNPLQAARLILSGGEAKSVVRERCLLGYCPADDGAHARVMMFDELGGVLMNSADRSRTLLQIAELLQESGVALEAEDLFGPIQELMAAGLLEIAD